MFNELPDFAPDGLTRARIDALMAEVDAELADQTRPQPTTRLLHAAATGPVGRDLPEQSLAPVIALRPRTAPAADTTEAA